MKYPITRKFLNLRRPSISSISATAKLEALLLRAQAQDLAAMTEAALMLARGDYAGVERDFGRALTLYQTAAEGGFVTAQYNLACMYMAGQGVERDYKQARIWLEKAAAAGDADAQFSLATICEAGLDNDGLADLDTAFKWYEQAAENGSGRAQYDLGCIYMHGKGKAADKQKAIYWFERAAACGVNRAKAHLKELLE